jgi:acyl carrier protein
VSLDRTQLIAELKQIIIDECDPEFTIDAITDDVRLIGEGLSMDSLDALQIALAVKDRYGVRVEGGPDSRKALMSVSALADFILESRAGS